MMPWNVTVTRLLIGDQGTHGGSGERRVLTHQVRPHHVQQAHRGVYKCIMTFVSFDLAAAAAAAYFMMGGDMIKPVNRKSR